MHHEKTEKGFSGINNEIPEILSILKSEIDKKFIFDFVKFR